MNTFELMTQHQLDNQVDNQVWLQTTNQVLQTFEDQVCQILALWIADESQLQVADAIADHIQLELTRPKTVVN